MVITDWVMPEVNGPTLCRPIRSGNFGGYAFIILLTRRGSHEDIMEGFAADADEFMTKPFHIGEVCARFRTGERILALELRKSSGGSADSEFIVQTDGANDGIQQLTRAHR